MNFTDSLLTQWHLIQSNIFVIFPHFISSIFLSSVLIEKSNCKLLALICCTLTIWKVQPHWMRFDEIFYWNQTQQRYTQMNTIKTRINETAFNCSHTTSLCYTHRKSFSNHYGIPQIITHICTAHIFKFPNVFQLKLKQRRV